MTTYTVYFTFTVYFWEENWFFTSLWNYSKSKNVDAIDYLQLEYEYWWTRYNFKSISIWKNELNYMIAPNLTWNDIFHLPLSDVVLSCWYDGTKEVLLWGGKYVFWCTETQETLSPSKVLSNSRINFPSKNIWVK